MAFDNEKITKILGDDIESIHDFIIYDLPKDFPFIYSASSEHVKMCLPCAQKAMRHHGGVGNPLNEDGLKVAVAYVSQVSEHSSILLEKTNEVMTENQKQIKEIQSAISELVQINKDNSTSNAQVLTELKDTIKKDLTRFYKIVTVISVPMIIGMSFVVNVISGAI